MSEQIKMTDAQFDYLCDEFFPIDKEMREQIRQQMKDKDMIHKSDLEILIEEAENILNEVLCVGNTKIIKEAFQAMKAELNIRRGVNEH